MRFTCNVCEHDNPCILIVKRTNGFYPRGCPFDPDNNGIEPEWREVKKIAKNTEQANQPDSGK